MPGKLLVVLDGGQLDMEVAVQAIAMAKEQDAQLRVVYVCASAPVLDTVVAVAEGFPLVETTQDHSAIQAKQAEQGHRALADVRALAQAANVMIRVRLLESADPIQEVQRHAWVHQCDLIVVAVHSDSLWQRVCGTSFTAQLLSQSRVPVLFCPQGANQKGSTGLFKAGLRARYRRRERNERRRHESND